jgi:hypothetical protein
MHRLLSRTSITEDEAVSILLGRTTGPIEFEPMDDDEEVDANCPAFCLRDTLEDELEVLDGEYRLAKYEKRPAHVIAEKFAALQHHKALIDQANIHLAAIRDEINKGERSVLRVDSALSNAAYTYITLHSFNEWVKRIGGELPGERPEAAVPTVSSPAPAGDATKPKPRIKLREQEDAILDEIRKLKSDPLELPINEPGKRGVKRDVFQSLRTSPLFKGSTTFDKAWERLRKHRRIVEKA